MSYMLDGRALQDPSRMRGIGTYVRGLLSGFAELGVAGEVDLLLRRDSPLPPEVETFALGVAPVRLLATKRRIQPMVDPFTVALALRRTRPDLYHSPDYAQPLISPCPVVVTVHDLIPFILRDMYPWLRRERLLALRQLRRADALIADSESTAADLARLASVTRERVHVVPLGVKPPPLGPTSEAITRVAKAHDLARPYLLAVGAFDPRKRIDDQVALLKQVRARLDVDLVIVGEQGIFAKRIEEAVRGAGMTSHVRTLGYVSGEDLSALYAGCRCLIFTSEYEGFGLPPLEAMAAGAPVAMYDNSSLREIAGDAAVVARDGDVTDLATRVIAVLENDGERAHRIEAGRAWSSRFTWRRTAEATLAVYESVLTAHRGRRDGSNYDRHR